MTYMQKNNNDEMDMTKDMTKEYMLSMDELIKKYPLGSKHLIDDEKYIVREHIQPMASTNMASYPAIRFEKVVEVKEEYKLYSQKYADSEEKLEIFNNKHKALNIFNALSDSYYHVHIEYYLNGKFQYNVCGSCKQEYIHNQEEIER